MKAAPDSVDGYIAGHPVAVQQMLLQVRGHVREALPTCGETISYAMPTITLHGRPLLHYAAWQHHLGLYPVPVGDDDLAQAVALAAQH